MRITAKAEYACLALVAIAEQQANGGSASSGGGNGQGPVSRVREIAEAHGIPERYLVQILIQLKAAGLVQSIRGSSGGYRLARPAQEITLFDVLSTVDGPTEPPRDLKSPAARALLSVIEQSRAAQREVLGKITIAELANPPQTWDWII